MHSSNFDYCVLAASLAIAGCSGSSATSLFTATDASQATDGCPASDDCASQQDGTVPPDGGITVEQACADVADAACSQMAKCSQISILVDFGDMSTCVARRTKNCTNSLAAPGTGATPATTEACVAAYPTYSCADFMNSNPPAVCRPQAGTGAAGDACAFDAQCQSAFCQIPLGNECGSCAPAPSPGASCADLAHCPSGLYCTKNSKICTTHAQLSDPCDSDTTCGYGLMCVGINADAGTQGTCMAAVSVDGGTCDHTLKTGPGCDSALNLYCTKSGACAPYSFASTGSACKFVDDAGTYTECTAGSTCLADPTTAQTGTCTGPAPDDQACDTSADNGCMTPAECVGTPVDGGVAGTCLFASAASCVSADN